MRIAKRKGEGAALTAPEEETMKKVLAMVGCLALACGVAWGQDSTATTATAIPWYDTLIGFVNHPQWKFLIALVGGQILRLAPGIEHKAIPMLLQTSNLVTVLIGALFGVHAAPGIATACLPWLDPKAGEIVAMGLFSGLSLGAVLDAVASVALASGVQSQVKNAAQWWRMGRVIVKQVRR